MIEDLRKWLNTGNNSAAKLAVALGYKHSQTIYNWLNRGDVPHYMKERVIHVIEQAKRKRSNSSRTRRRPGGKKHL